MALFTMALALLGSGVVLMLAFYGMVPMRPVVLWGSVNLLGLLCMTLLIRFGITRNWRDPALTQWQILWAIGFVALGYVVAPPARSGLPSMMVMAVMFSALALEVRQIAYIAIFALMAYTMAISATYLGRPLKLEPQELANVCFLLITLSGTVLLSIQITRMRMRLRKRSQELQQALRRNQEMASRDDLTGLCNRRHMQEQIELECARATRHRRPLMLAQVDLDHFKRINDTSGHAAGDVALRAFACIAQSSIRTSDVLSRWGGEEFVLMLVDTDSHSGHIVLQRLRRAVEAAEVIDPLTQTSISMTVSIGATLYVPGEVVETTLARADTALYEAKRGGRNRVVEAPAPLSVVPSVCVPAPAAD